MCMGRGVMATNKQKTLARKILENPSTTEVTSAEMQAVGYSPNTRPNEITNTKGWVELMEKHLPDGRLLTKHEQLLEATKPISARIVGKDADEGTDDFIEVPDNPVQAKALELAYKIKGKLETQTQVNILNQGGDMSLEFTEK